MKRVLTHAGARRGWLVAVGAAAFVLVLAAVPPVLPEGLRDGVMHAFAGVCHQLPRRSFAVGGVPLALCHRCLGLVVGLLAGALLMPVVGGRLRRLVRNDGLLLALAGLPAALDWGLGVLGLWANTPLSRFATGALFGLAAGHLVARMLALDPARRPVPAAGDADG